MFGSNTTVNTVDNILLIIAIEFSREHNQ